METNTSNISSNTVVAQGTGNPPPATTPAPSGKAKVAISSFDRASNATLIVITGYVVTGMTGNPVYTSPNPKLADFVATRNDFISAVNAAKGNTIGIAVCKQKKAALVASLRMLAHYVQVTCGGDLPTLLSSGFTAQRSRQPIGRLPAPLNLRLVRGKVSGEITARFKKLAQAGAYEWRYATTTAPNVWVRCDTTLAAGTTLTDLEPGTQYIVQVRAIGTAGPSDWSDAATLMAA